MRHTTIGTGRGILAGVTACVLLLALPTVARAQEVDYTNTVTVAAGGKVELEADVATVGFGVRAAHAEAVTATRKAAEKTESVVAALRRAGVTEEELTVGGVRLNRKTDRKGNFLRYVASVSVRVKTERLGAIGEIIDAAVSAGATSIRSLEYDVKDRSAGVQQALREAMVFARAKAEALAEVEGRQVGPAIVISEHDSRPPRATEFDTTDAVAAGRVSNALAATIPLVPPTLTAQARITVTFELI